MRTNNSEDKISAYRAQIGGVNTKLDRLTDALIEDRIDATAHDERRVRLLAERQQIENHIRSLQDATLKPDNVQVFLEHVTSLTESYIVGDPTIKREIVFLATSNRTVRERNLELEPSNWLSDLSHAEGVLQCAREWVKTRTLLKENQAHDTLRP